MRLFPEENKNKNLRLFLLLALLLLSVGFFIFPVYVPDLTTLPVIQSYLDYRAISKLTDKAERGDVTAIRFLGYRYARSIDSKRNYQKAFEYYSKAAELGDAPSQHSLGVLYQKGRLGPVDTQKALFWYKLAAEQNFIPSRRTLAQYYYSQENYTEAFPWYMGFAEDNDAYAQSVIGYFYRKGLGVEKDLDAAMHWYMRSAEGDNNFAQTELGSIFYDQEEYEKALFWYEKAAADGNAHAQTMIGYFCDHGYAVEKNTEKAAEWYIKASKGGNQVAQYNLGLLYQYDDDMKDLEQAFYWYREAAEQGYPNAQKKLVNCFHKGIGVPKDDIEAFAWQYTYMLSKDIRKSDPADALFLMVERAAFLKNMTEEQKETARERANEYLIRYGNKTNAQR